MKVPYQPSPWPRDWRFVPAYVVDEFRRIANAQLDPATVALVESLNAEALTLLSALLAVDSQRIVARKTAGTGPVEQCTLSEVLDFIGSAAQGDILYRGASAWARLPAGTSGHFLKTLGAGADPAWSATPAAAGFEFAGQTSDLVIASNTVFQDTGLVIPLTAGTYSIEAFFCALSHATPDMEVQVMTDATLTKAAIFRSSARGAATSFLEQATLPIVYNLNETDEYVTTFFGFLKVSTSGNLKVQARQVTSSATSVTFREGSWIRATQIA